MKQPLGPSVIQGASRFPDSCLTGLPMTESPHARPFSPPMCVALVTTPIPLCIWGACEDTLRASSSWSPGQPRPTFPSRRLRPDHRSHGGHHWSKHAQGVAHLHAGFPFFLSSLFPALLLDLLRLPDEQSCIHGGPAFSWALGEGRP